jgi:uncharacterized protein (TIGR03086 family)
MSQGRPRAPTADGVMLLERAIGYALGTLRLVTPADLTGPTPCMGWDVRTLLAHIDDGLVALQEAADAHAVALDPPGLERSRSDADPSAGLRERASWLLGAWCGPHRPDTVEVGGLPLAASIVTTTGALELAVHGWDVATACGHPRPLPPALASELLALAPLLVTDAERPGHFDPPVPVPNVASSGDRLLAYLGRQPDRPL